MDKHSTELSEGTESNRKKLDTTDEHSEEDDKEDEPDSSNTIIDEKDPGKSDDIKERGTTIDDGSVDSRFKTLFSEAALQLADSIRLKKFEEKFSKSLLIRSAVKESMGKE